MKVGLASDLRLEFDGDLPDAFFAWRGDVLLLAGDIAPIRVLRSPRGQEFLERVAECAPHVFMVAGNHEFYHDDIVKGPEKIRNALTVTRNIQLLDDTFVEVEGVKFFGATYWTDFNGRNPTDMAFAATMMNDYRQIRVSSDGFRRLLPRDVVQRHSISKSAIRQFYQCTDGPVVIVTHHAPSYQSVHQKHHDHPLNSAFYSENSDFILEMPHVQTWCHGHMHDAVDYTVGETRVLCNPRGYPGESDARYAPLTFEVAVTSSDNDTKVA